MRPKVVNIGDSEKVAFSTSLRETLVVSLSGLGVAALFYLADATFATERTKEGLSELLHHFNAVPIYFPVVAGWVVAAAVLIDALLYELEVRKEMRRPEWFVETLRVCLEGLSHVHAFPVLVLVLVVAFHTAGRGSLMPWLTVLIMALVAVLAGLAAKLVVTTIDARTWAERLAPYPYFAVWTVGLLKAVGWF